MLLLRVKLLLKLGVCLAFGVDGMLQAGVHLHGVFLKLWTSFSIALCFPYLNFPLYFSASSRDIERQDLCMSML